MLCYAMLNGLESKMGRGFNRKQNGSFESVTGCCVVGESCVLGKRVAAARVKSFLSNSVVAFL